jgi:hypothetical protein
MFRPTVTIPSTNFIFPEPRDYRAGIHTLVGSARNANGYATLDVLRDEVFKAEMIWGFLTCEDWAEINKQFIRRWDGKFVNMVELYVTNLNIWETRELYVSDRTDGSVFWRDPRTMHFRGVKECRLALIEC